MRMLHKTLKKTSTMTKIMTPRGKAAKALSDNHGLGARTPEDAGLCSPADRLSGGDGENDQKIVLREENLSWHLRLESYCT